MLFSPRLSAKDTKSVQNELLMDLANYTPYSETALNNSMTYGKTVLFFAATPWCQTCSVLDKEIIERHSELPTGVTVLKVDYDNDKDMNNKYYVTTQHTLILLDESGQELTRWVGGNFDALLSEIDESK